MLQFYIYPLGGIHSPAIGVLMIIVIHELLYRLELITVWMEGLILSIITHLWWTAQTYGDCIHYNSFMNYTHFQYQNFNNTSHIV